MSTPEEDFKEQGFHSKSEMRRLNIQRTVGTDGLKEVSEEAKGNGVQVSSRAPLTLEQKIEEDFSKLFPGPSFSDITKSVMEGAECPLTIQEGRIEGFKAAALPLHKEIQELREALLKFANEDCDCKTRPESQWCISYKLFKKFKLGKATDK